MVAGGGAGYGLATGLGIAGAPVAIPAAPAGLGIGAIIGNRAGDIFDNMTVQCPNC